jgi:catechol 2,3-dioxygenase-like lactoylglutathione lyase family enzyme
MTNTEFELGGINHLALVSSDMKRTIDFYSGVLGMPLVKTLDLPGTMGQHFFFDCGGGDCVAFFWFPDAPDGVPGISAPKSRPEQGDLLSAVGSMNHVAFHVPADKFDGRGRPPRAQDGRRPHRPEEREGDVCHACVRSPAPR